MKSVMHKGFRWLFSKIRDSRLKTKMTLLVLLSVFVPLLVSTSLFNSFSAENISRSQEQNAQNAYSQLQDLFSTRVDVVQQDICLLLQDANVRALLQSPVANWDIQKLPQDKAMMNAEVGFGRRVLQVFEENEISFEHTPSGIDTFSVLVHQEEFANKEQDVIAGLHRAVNPDNIFLESDLALVAIVGRGMKNARGTAGRLCTALADAGINIKMIDQGSSELNIIVGIQNEDFRRAIRTIYHEFIEKEQ